MVIQVPTGHSNQKKSMQLEHITLGRNSYEKVKTLKYLGSLLTNQDYIHEEIWYRLKAGNSSYYSVPDSLFNISLNLGIKMYNITLTVLTVKCKKGGIQTKDA